MVGAKPKPKATSVDARATRDLHAGRRLSLAMEDLGECLVAMDALPPALRAPCLAMAQGLSVVPADGDRVDFVFRVREGTVADAGVVALMSWLGQSVTDWLLTHATPTLCEAIDLAVDARCELMAPWEGSARAHHAWYSAGLPESSVEVFRTASRLALGEACDRWCALGNEGDLGRYVATWQRSASGWAESVLGTRVEIPMGDLARLRELSAAVREMSMRSEGGAVSAALARRLGWTRDEVERLLRVSARVEERTDPVTMLKRRWSVAGPIARAVGVLEGTLGRLPTIAEVAAHAGVHEVSVELVLEALDGG